jgi:hypothetical protein
MKQGVVSPLLFNIARECAIKKVQENREELYLNGTHQSLVYAHIVNLFGEKVDTNCSRYQ